MSDEFRDTPQITQKINEETLKYPQQNSENCKTTAKADDIKTLNVSSKKNKTLLRWDKITLNWRTKQPKQSDQLTTETIVQNLPSVDKLDSLDLSSTHIYENKKKKLFSKFTKKRIAIKA